MKNVNDIRVEMVRVVGDLAPFVKIDYVDTDAQEHSGLLIVDSCCVHNILFGKRASILGLVYNPTNETVSIGTIANTKVTTSVGKVAFTFEGGQFVEPFCISDNDNDIPSHVGDLPIIGILGNLFLQKFNLSIDYSNYTLHTSNACTESMPISDCDFFFPMEIGLKNYGLPILSLRQDGKEVVALADTGSTNNVLSSQVITELGFDCQYLKTTDAVAGVKGCVEAKDAVMSFCLLTLTEDDKDEVSHKDVFKVLPHTLISPEEGQCDENGNQLPPVVSLIGSPFMSRENWVLDFGAKIIYRRKTDKPKKWNVRVRVYQTVKSIFPFFEISY